MSDKTKADGEGEKAPETVTETDAAITEALTTRETTTGIPAAVEAIRASLDEDAHVMWSANGPRGTHIERIACVMASVDGARRLILVAGYQSGAFKLFGEVAGKTGADQVSELSDPDC